MSRSLVCSIGEHASCDGNAPNGPAGIGHPCECACGHRLVLTPAERERERLRAQRRARLAERAPWHPIDPGDEAAFERWGIVPAERAPETPRADG